MKLHVILPAALATVANVWPAPSTAQQFGMSAVLLHYDKYDAGPLLGYDVSFRFHKPAVFVAWQTRSARGMGATTFAVTSRMYRASVKRMYVFTSTSGASASATRWLSRECAGAPLSCPR